MGKEKIELEYSVNTSPKILYYRLSNPAGLEEWFADKVNVKQDIYNFKWAQSEQSAKLIEKKANHFIRFSWCDSDDESFFEFKIQKQEVTGDIALKLTDFTTPEDKEETIDMWDEQVSQLKSILGV